MQFEVLEQFPITSRVFLFKGKGKLRYIDGTSVLIVYDECCGYEEGSKE